MTPFLPEVRAKDITRADERRGFVFDGQSGSHAVYYRESDKRRVVAPVHKGKGIKPKALYGIVKDLGIEPEEFKKLL